LLIAAIADNQNAGRFEACSRYLQLLHQNLMYLAAVADSQPPTDPPPTPSR
jgi:hypothetical protein